MYDLMPEGLWLLCLVPCLVICGVLIPSLVDLCLRAIFSLRRPVQLTATLRQISELQAELSRTSQMDQFAAYSRLQRKINALQSTCRVHESRMNMQKLKCRIISTSLLYLLMLIVMVCVVRRYSGIPVIRLPAASLFPLSCILAYPDCDTGGVSVAAWCVVCTVVVKRAAKFLRAV